MKLRQEIRFDIFFLGGFGCGYMWGTRCSAVGGGWDLGVGLYGWSKVL